MAFTSTSFRRACRRIADPARVEHIVVTSLASGALALVDPNRRSARGRVALRAASAVLSGFIVWADTRRTRPASETLGIAAASVGATLAFADLGDVIDGRMQRALVRVGVPHPRLALAIGTTALTAVTQTAAERLSPSDPSDDGVDVDAPDDETLVDVPEAAREIVTALLARADGWGVSELRAQLDAARAVEYAHEDDPAFVPALGFAVPSDLPLAVPGDARFPVVGRFTTPAGLDVDAYLMVQEGRLGVLALAPAEHEDGFAGLDELEHWPASDELTFLVETPSGVRPLEIDVETGPEAAPPTADAP